MSRQADLDRERATDPASGAIDREPATDPRSIEARRKPSSNPTHADARPAPDIDPTSIEAGRELLAWYRGNARDLPWRHTRDPYSILVSEVMLQQTRVETVRERWGRFLERFPDPSTLAAAGRDEVLAEWSGLGYYRRARALHDAAARLVADHGGRLPADLDALRDLPGIGPYTAAAVGAIAWDLPAVAFDGNVARVLSRLVASRDDPRRAPVRRRLEAIVEPWLGELPPGDLAQALMELGATVCTPRSPACRACPWQGRCRARAAGLQEEIPPRRRLEVKEVVEAAAVIEDEGRFLLLRGQRPGVLQEMWEFPTVDSRLVDDGEDPRAVLGGYLDRLGVEVRLSGAFGEVRHGITTRRIRCRVFRASPDGGEGAPGRAGDALLASTDDAGWFSRDEISDLPVAASTRKILGLLGQPDLLAGAGSDGAADSRAGEKRT